MNRSPSGSAALRITLLVLGLVPGTALAGDGVIEINQSVAIAGGVTGDLTADPPGFPVRINQTGSYRLTGNLAVPLNTDAIQIDANNVTLDLNGFEINGGSVCTGYPPTTCTGSTGAGVRASGYLVVVKNGSVTGMGSTCLVLGGPSSEADRVRLLGCGGNGDIEALGGMVRVTDSFIGVNHGFGIISTEGALIEGNEIRANYAGGITIGPGPLFRLATSIVGNRVFDNGNAGGAFTSGGISGGSLSILISGNFIAANAGTAHFSGVRSAGDNMCVTAPC